MKKNLLFGAFMLLIVSRIGAQSAIVLTESNFPILPGPFHYSVSYPKTVTVPINGADIMWDYSSLKSDGAVTEAFLSNFSNPFTKSKTAIADTGKLEFLTSDNNVSETDFYDEDSKGFYFEGDYVKAQDFSLANYFGDSSDKIIVPQQNDVLRLNVVGFPTTFGTSAHYQATKSLNFLWTVQSANMDSTPSIKKTFYKATDTVTGWGTLRIPDSTKKSIAYPVLLIRRKVMIIDSYYVNQQPAAKYFLIAFGIVQGAKTIDCNEYFYRAGHQNPLLTIGFGTDTNYVTPTSVLYGTDSIEKQAGIEQGQAGNPDFSLYPNPASANQVNCSFTKESAGQWRILIFNSIGQVLRSQNIEGNGKISMYLDISSAKAGLYFVNILDENGQVVANGKLSIAH